MNSKNPKVDAFLDRAEKWQAEMTKLRSILLGCGLTEDVKWGKPCYTYEGTNITVLAGFKDHCVLIFAKGSLLNDPQGLLIKAGENTQGMRQMRFASLQQIVEREDILRTFIHEAIAAEKAGLKVDFSANKELVYPEEFQEKLDADPTLKTAFEALTPGRRRVYNMFFTGAKQSKTRSARVEKCLPQILAGKGMDD